MNGRADIAAGKMKTMRTQPIRRITSQNAARPIVRSRARLLSGLLLIGP